MTGDWVSRGQQANPGLPGKWMLKRCVCVCMYVFSFSALTLFFGIMAHNSPALAIFTACHL